MAIKPSQFRAVQSEASNNTIRVNRASEDPKGQVTSIHISGRGFWGSVVNFFRDIGEWFSNRFKKNSYGADRSARAQQAYDEFKQVLSGMTSEQSAQRILEQVAPRQPENKPQTLSPLQVRRALELAEAEIRLQNDQLIAGLMPRGSLEQDDPSFNDLCKMAKVKDLEPFRALFQPSEFATTDGALHVYTKMLQGMTEVHSRGQSKALSPEELQTFATCALGALRAMKSQEVATQLAARYESARMQFQDLLVTITEGRYDSFEADLEGARDELNMLIVALTSEGHHEYGADETTVFTDALIGSALSSLTPRQRDTLAAIDLEKQVPRSETPSLHSVEVLVRSFLGEWKPR